MNTKEQAKMYRENAPEDYLTFIVTEKGLKYYEISESEYLEDESLIFSTTIKVKKKCTVFGHGICDRNKRILNYRGYLTIVLPIDELNADFTITPVEKE